MRIMFLPNQSIHFTSLHHTPLQIALKCSDLGHLTSSIEVHKKWVALLEEVSY